MLIKELVAGMSALDDTARTGCAAVCFGVSGIPLRPAAHRGRVEREPPVHRRVPGVCPVYLRLTRLYGREHGPARAVRAARRRERRKEGAPLRYAVPSFAQQITGAMQLLKDCDEPVIRSEFCAGLLFAQGSLATASAIYMIDKHIHMHVHCTCTYTYHSYIYIQHFYVRTCIHTCLCVCVCVCVCVCIVCV